MCRKRGMIVYLVELMEARIVPARMNPRLKYRFFNSFKNDKLQIHLNLSNLNTAKHEIFFLLCRAF